MSIIRFLRRGPFALLIIVVVPALAAAATIQFDVSSVFNADVIVNDSTAGPLDAVNDPVDSPITSNTAFVTQAAATALGCLSPPNLPNDGFFAATADHPDVQLGYSNESNGLNTRRSAFADTYTFPVPMGNYTTTHFFFTAGEASANPDPSVTISLLYTTGFPTVANLTVPDWFEEAVAPTYQLFNGGDRSSATAPTFCDNVNDPAIFGFKIPRTQRACSRVLPCCAPIQVRPYSAFSVGRA